MDFTEKFIEALPQAASNPFALIAYTVLVLSWVFIASKVNRNKNLLNSLEKLPPEDRIVAFGNEINGVVLNEGVSPEQWLKHRKYQYFFLGFLALCLVAIIIGLNIKYPTLSSGPDSEMRFKATASQKDVQFFQLTKDKVRVNFNLHFEPKINDNQKAATIFIGYFNAHNEKNVDASKPVNPTTDGDPLATCSQIKSCLYSRTFNEYKKDPVIVRGTELGETSTNLQFDIPSTVKVLRLHWDFYQKEADDGNACVEDSSRIELPEGIPFLKVVDKSGNKISDDCYHSEDRLIVPVKIN